VADLVPSGSDASTRDRILAAAATALSIKGYSKTHMADIANLAEVQPPAVYYYFESREDLIGSVMREGQRMVREHVESALAALPPTSAIRDRVATAVEAHLRVELELSDFATAVTRNAGQLPPHLREGLTDESEAFHDVWRALLREAHEDGLLHGDLDPGIARMLTIGALNWATEWWHPGITVDEMVATAQQLVGAALFRR
jgi:AcrR family transcriptional regulator